MAQAKPKVVFMFQSSDADPVKHRANMVLDSAELIIVGVKDYNQATKVSRDLMKEGVSAFELCAGFGNIGVARVAEAVKGVPVGVVRFDRHPLLQGKSGDQLLGLIP
jgi:hypothetical protein